MIDGRDEGLRARARDPGRRLPRRGRRARSSRSRSASRTRSRWRSRKGSPSRSHENRIKIEGADRCRVGQFAVGRARDPRRPSPTRARASATSANTSGARSARPRWVEVEHEEEDPQRRSAARIRRAAPRVARAHRALGPAAAHRVPHARSTSTRSSWTRAARRSAPSRRAREGVAGEGATGQRRGREEGRQGDRRAGAQNEIEEVVFHRNGFLYHGRVKALADAAREAGLQF